MEENKNTNTRRLEPEVKAPDSIRKGIQSTLNSYKMMGDVAGLYLDGFSQTLVGFADLLNPQNKKKQRPKT